MKNYWVMIKSGSELPDFDMEFKAKNDEEAVNQICSQVQLPKEFVRSNIIEDLGKEYRTLSDNKIHTWNSI